ncbi:hypothetical protein LCX93_11475 [Sulfurimonas sp. SWIR-19]|uniref:hypothetical protein n=1 Tax=Sulfurimonas sp. SWIR-19 TaxID=2878390 RepID=UPI001CF54570|nr:hypothetical protein [Sulfurimonas sp. SWIR-19]UCN00131.1 hypothetical protein LCX93_11475 [Sulfurimonas sp. SWIR-19]
MVKLVVGGVTMAAVAYAIKEFCENECWVDRKHCSSVDSEDKETSGTNKERLKAFYALKKKIYKKSLKKYQLLIEQYQPEDYYKPKMNKIPKEDLDNSLPASYINLYIEKIEYALERLYKQLKKSLQEESKDFAKKSENIQTIYKQMKAIDKLVNLRLLTKNGTINKQEILQTVSKAHDYIINDYDAIFSDITLNADR